MGKLFLRKSAVATRYGINERTVDRMKRDGRLPAPIYMGRKVPLWDCAELDEFDRRATRQRTPAATQAA